jgi:hypothetical protein
MTFETYRDLTDILQATFFPVFTYYLVVYTSLECLKKKLMHSTATKRKKDWFEP